MNKELYVSSTPHETKVALVEDDQLAEVFFERENEYTLAGSIYKGRVTRVLPGMQSAFVDIGLERDAFLYVSDFLELSGEDEEDEDFGEIPTPRGTIDFGKAQPATEAATSETQTQITGPEVEEETESFEEESAGDEEQASAENGEGQAGEDREGGDNARRWRGRRRRRGGRRGGRVEREEQPQAAQAAEPPPQESLPRSEPREARESRESRPRQEYGPPAGYTPIILPGESISKYRNISQQASEVEAAPVEDESIAQEHHVAGESAVETPAAVAEEIQEEATHLDQGFEAEQPVVEQHEPAHEAPETVAAASEEEQRPRSKRRWGWRRRAAEQQQTETAATEAATASQPAGHSEAAAEVASEPADEAASSPHSGVEQQETRELSEIGTEHAAAESQYTAEDHRSFAGTPEHEHEVDTPGGSFEIETVDASHNAMHSEQHAAPSTAPEGRTLEHEVLEDDEMEFHPVPDDLSAMREVAGDEELVLEEETMQAGSTFDRWVPKIDDVDEDEIVAAEERGENIFEEEHEEEDNEVEGNEEEANDRAEVRAATPTAGYQQRQTQRPGYERRGRFDRGRRGGGRRNNMRSRPNNSRNQPLITDLLKEGQEVLIQIAKEPIGKKGARITSHIALPGRFLVYMPTVNHVGVSRKISSDEERQRLKRIVTSERENGLGGFIVRTAAANIKEEDLRADIRFLKHLWHEIKDRAENSKSPALIYHDLNLVERVLRDQVNADFSQIWVDTEDEYERVVRFANRFQPSLVRRIKLYTKDAPLFEEFGIQDEINRSLKSKVWLKSGGHIVINQTEALVAIDVNTGKYVGKTQRLEDTIVKTNVDAIKEIVRQIRLRDLGGIIVIDFIDMDERKNRQKVMAALEDALRSDRAPSKVLQFNDFGLVAITRKRVKQSLERTLGESCPYCTGAGFVKSVPTVCNELYTEMRKMARVHDKNDISLRVNPEVAKALKANNGKLITELEDLTGKTVLVKSDPALHQEMFDIH